MTFLDKFQIFALGQSSNGMQRLSSLFLINPSSQTHLGLLISMHWIRGLNFSGSNGHVGWQIEEFTRKTSFSLVQFSAIDIRWIFNLINNKIYITHLFLQIQSTKRSVMQGKLQQMGTSSLGELQQCEVITIRCAFK